jgi:hypothetical protein
MLPEQGTAGYSHTDDPAQRALAEALWKKIG